MGSQVSKPETTGPATPMTFDEKKAVIRENHIDQTKGKGETMNVSLKRSQLTDWSKDFEDSPFLPLSQLVLSKNDPIQTLSSRSASIADVKVFNLSLKGLGPKGEYPGPRVNQASSGRCWLFATTNVLRYNVIEKLNLGDFQLSQSYLFFYDKLEKANYYLENILETKDEPVDSRTVSWLNQAPVNDGGQWDMAINLTEKYGIIPQTLYPESFSSSASSRMDSILTSKLREYSTILRSSSSSSTSKSIGELKAQFMHEIYNLLSVTLGTPPRADEKLTWDYYDKDDKYHQWTGTPLEFYEQFGKRKGMDPKDSFSLINDPRNEYEKLYTVNRLGNVKEGRGIRYVNAPIEVLEDAVISGIKSNTPLFFGCDVGKQSSTPLGIMDTNLFNLQAAYGFSLNMSKADRLRTGETAMTHAMVITAVHLDNKGRPLKYKVENSWSDTAGEKGWFMMTNTWFKENVFQVVIPRCCTEKKWLDVLDKGEPIVLDSWDPMGTLA